MVKYDLLDFYDDRLRFILYHDTDNHRAYLYRLYRDGRKQQRFYPNSVKSFVLFSDRDEFTVYFDSLGNVISFAYNGLEWSCPVQLEVNYVRS